ncbi:hypothetical protein F4680DRAFT_306256 [Xylaria scruposa]|nr:hypothetical protein F4680DRAFT_306256 [Xylaria scruposa]
MVRPQRSPYSRVVVRGIFWEGHNQYHRGGLVFNAEQELHMVLNAFQSYGYNVRQMPIPQDPRRRSGFPDFLKDRLVNFASSSPRTLIVLYYQGHGALDRHGHLLLSNGNGQQMHWSEIANAIINVRCDVLAILNCCHAGAAMRDSPRHRPNYERYAKEVMMATPHNQKTYWGSASGFAACLEQALRDLRYNWMLNFRGIAPHWAHYINCIMKQKKPDSRHPVGVRHLIKPPESTRRGHPYEIVLSPLSVC